MNPMTFPTPEKNDLNLRKPPSPEVRSGAICVRLEGHGPEFSADD